MCDGGGPGSFASGQGLWTNVRTLLLDYTQEEGPTLTPKPVLAQSNTSTETGVGPVLAQGGVSSGSLNERYPANIRFLPLKLRD